MMRITATTDKQFVGKEFDETQNPVVLDDDVSMYVDRVIQLDSGLRFISSNYIIDAEGI